MTYAEVAEGVRAVIAAYCHAVDDGRTDDIVAMFCPDASATLPGADTITGRDALRQAYSGWKPRGPQRHLVANTVITDWNDDEVHAVSDVTFIAQGKDGWAIHLVGRYHDTLHHADGAWIFHDRTLIVASAP